MARIQPVNHETATGTTRELLDGVQKKFGKVPNMLGTLAHSPAALQAFLSLGDVLGAGELPAKLREQIALAVAGTNGCEYCASAHKAIGAGAGISADEALANVRGQASDPKTQAAIDFATTIVEKRGWISDDDFQAVRQAGFGDGAISEIIAAVALNTYTNYFNHIAQPEVDFPRVEVSTPAGV